MGSLIDLLEESSARAHSRPEIRAVAVSDDSNNSSFVWNEPADTDQNSPYYTRGRNLLQEGRPAVAIKYFRKALGRGVGDVDTLNGLAIAYWEIGREDVGVKYFQKALAIDPANSATFNNVGYAALKSNELELADEMLSTAKAIGGSPVIKANLNLLEQALEAIERLERLVYAHHQPVAQLPTPRVQRIDRKRVRLTTMVNGASSIAKAASVMPDHKCTDSRRWLNYTPSVGFDCEILQEDLNDALAASTAALQRRKFYQMRVQVSE
jgi:tetratricopeptide (TPR) repeat protein